MSVRFVRKGQNVGTHLMGHVVGSAVFGGGGGDTPLTGAMLVAGYVEADQVTVSGLPDKGAGAPASSFTINKTNTGNLNEWGYVVGMDTTKAVTWVRMLEGVNGLSSNRDLCTVIGLAYKPGDTHAYFTWSSRGDNVQVRDENDVVIATYNRPPNSGPGLYYTAWGGVTAVNIQTGAVAWTTVIDFDTPINSSTLFRLQPFQISWGGPDNNDLVVGICMQTQKSTAPIPKPTFGSGTVATYPNIDFARVGNSAVCGTWLVKVNPTNGDAAGTSDHVANFNDDIASAGTPFRGFDATDRFNQYNFLWNPVTELWYLSANHSGYASLNVFGTIVGNSRAGQINTRGTDNFGGNLSLKPYLCTYDANFDPQNVVTLAPTVLNNGNARYAYQHSVELVPDGSGSVFWGWQNMQASPAVDLERQGVLGNYGAPYVPTDQVQNNSVILRLDNNLEVEWESSAFASAFAGLGRGHGIRMVPHPSNSNAMLAVISTQGVNTPTSTSATLFGGGPFTFSSLQSYTVAFDITTGASINEREIAPQTNFDKCVGIKPTYAESGPDTGKSYVPVHQHNPTATTIQGFYNTAGTRVYNPADYWNSNGAVYPSVGTSDAVHILCYGTDGEPDLTQSFPLIAVKFGFTASNAWALHAIPL